MAQTVKNLPAMQEAQVQSLDQGDALEKGMATHSSILAWRIPKTGEPGGIAKPGGIAELDMTEHTALIHFGMLYFHIHLYQGIF